MKTLRTFLLVSSVAASLAACDLEFGDLDQPDLGEQLGDPDPASIAAAATGLLVRQRLGMSNQAGYVSELGVFGRESYVLDPADGRFQGELLSSSPNGGTSLNPGNGNFGGNFWDLQYRTIRWGVFVLQTADLDATATFLSDDEISALKGWALFHQAWAMHIVVNTHTCPPAIEDNDLCKPTGPPPDGLQYGVVLAFENIDPLDPSTLTPEALEANAPIVNDAALGYAKVIELIDASIAQLEAAGNAEFPFVVPSGFRDFNTPAALIPVLHAFKARVALYNDDMATAATALDASFLDEADTSFVDGVTKDIGVFHNFSQNTGDATNGLFADPDILAHPSFETDAEMQADGVTPDRRFGQKIRFNADGDDEGTEPDPTTIADLTSTINFGGLYPTNTTGIPYIRNEELILIRAEVLARTGDLTEAAALVNFIRENSGGLAPLDAGTELDTEEKLLDEILAQRRYSLMFEGGHRWLDVRRLGRTDTLPLDRDGDIVNLSFPVNGDEVNARVPVE